MSRIQTEAIPLRAIRYSDTSQVVTLITAEAGTVRAIAKGAWTRKGGAVDHLRIYRTTVALSRSGALASLTDWLCTEPLAGLRRDLDRFIAASYKVEIVSFLAPEGVPVEPIYRLLRASLVALGDGAEPAANTLIFAARMLALSGFQPSLAGCGECGREVPLRGQVVFGEGNLWCKAHRHPHSRTYAGAALALLQSIPPAGTPERGDSRYPEHLLAEAQEFLDDRFREMTERDLRTMRYWKKWGSRARTARPKGRRPSEPRIG